jgi:pantoate--beta-alanine ligase
MIIIRSAALLQQIVSAQQAENRRVGFVPTMGALHAGHLSLLQRCRDQSDVSIVSIFVNPTQFNEATDLQQYPKTPKEDEKGLAEAGCDILFMPSVEEIYPHGTETGPGADLAGLDQVLEGAFRPGHFAGVVQVVSRLLDIVTPDQLFMGQKDYQQFAIIRRMIAEQDRPVEIVMGPTIRENDGLAMSSRNVRLTRDFRQKAPLIHACLQEAKASLGQIEITDIEKIAISKLEAAGFQPEYFAVVDAFTLRPVAAFSEEQELVACVAAWAGEVRLIDNLILS